MTPAEKLAEALRSLDHARRTLEALEATGCGDQDIDAAVGEAAEDVEAHIANLAAFYAECVGA